MGPDTRCPFSVAIGLPWPHGLVYLEVSVLSPAEPSLRGNEIQEIKGAEFIRESTGGPGPETCHAHQWPCHLKSASWGDVVFGV